MASDHHQTVELPTTTAGTAEQDIPEEMMAELKKEIARNVEATKLVKQREIEATYARDRAADSRRRMQEMMQKYEEMKNKLEWTRLTLAETHNRLEQHNTARSERIRQSVTQLKEKADICTQKLNLRAVVGGGGGDGNVPAADIMPENNSNNTNTSSEDAGGLTDAERMLLLMCQEQMAKDQEEANLAATPPPPAVPAEAAVNEPVDVEAAADTFVSTTTNALDDVIVAEPPKPYKPAKDYAKTVLDLQMKLSSGVTRPVPSAPAAPAAVEPVATKEKKSVLEEEANPAATSVQSESNTADASQQEVTKNECAAAVGRNDEGAAANANVTKESAAASSCSPTTTTEGGAVASAAVVEDTAAEKEKSTAEITMDLNEQVSKMHAKCASVREELGQMAMSEQYMRTKQAQLLAKTREREAQLAIELAAEKEREAQAMRKKVTDMMKLLEERKNKLKMTEVVLEKKAVVVEKVNKILDSKERRAKNVEKQHAECLAFDKKQKKN